MQIQDVLKITIFIQVALLAAIGLNVFLAREILGFVYLVFIIGFLFLRAFKVNNLGFARTALLSVGISLSFLMFFGLLLNTLIPILGFGAPLSTSFLMVSILGFTLGLSIYLYFIDRNNRNTVPISIEFTRSHSAWTPRRIFFIFVFLIFVPLLTVIGAELANFSDYTFVLMLLVIATTLVVLSSFFKLIPPRIYPLALFAIAFFLLFGTSLVSNYIIGSDVHLESYFAQVTSINSIWNWKIPHDYNGMLSITILPTIFHNFTDIDINWIFKLAYPLIYCLVPITLYFIYKKQTNAFVAFLAVFFFMSMDTFYLEILAAAREMIGELFLALSILMLIDDKLSLNKRKILLMFFAVATVVSHYSLGYILMGFLAVALVLTSVFKQTDNKSATIVTPVMFFGVVIIAFIWNLFVSPASFETLASFVGNIYRQLAMFSSPPGIGGLLPGYFSPLHEFSKYLFLLLQGLIAIGFIGLFLRRKRFRFNRYYVAICVASLAIVLLTVALPSFAAGFNESRFYHLALFFLAPLCVIGGMFILSLAADLKAKILSFNWKARGRLSRRGKRVWMFLISILLVLFFLFQVGFVYEIAGDSTPTSLPLSMDRKNAWTDYLNALYIEPQEVAVAQWLGTYENRGLLVYGDQSAKYLMSYGLVPYNNTYYYVLDPDLRIQHSLSPAYFVFGKMNLVDNKVITNKGEYNMTDFSFITNSTDKIYSNGDCDVYYG